MQQRQQQKRKNRFNKSTQREIERMNNDRGRGGVGDNNSDNNGVRRANNANGGQVRNYGRGVEVHVGENGEETVLINDRHGLSRADLASMLVNGITPPLLFVSDSRLSCDFCDTEVSPITVTNHYRHCQRLRESGESLQDVLAQRWECGYCGEVMTTERVRRHITHCRHNPNSARSRRGGR